MLNIIGTFYERACRDSQQKVVDDHVGWVFWVVWLSWFGVEKLELSCSKLKKLKNSRKTQTQDSSCRHAIAIIPIICRAIWLRVPAFFTKVARRIRFSKIENIDHLWEKSENIDHHVHEKLWIQNLAKNLLAFLRSRSAKTLVFRCWVFCTSRFRLKFVKSRFQIPKKRIALIQFFRT